MSKTKSAQKATLEKKLILKEILAPKIQNFESLFASLEFGSFSHSISLQEYQIAALKSAIAALSLYTQSPDSLYQNYLECGLEGITKEQINTASFWMATGSGKSIVMIKFIALLHDLFALKTLPAKPIMLLVPNDKILEQFKAHIKEYNAYQSKTIAYKDLKDYESVNYGTSLFDENIVFIGRSDLLDTSENVGKDSKAKRLNYKNFLRDEGWIVLLDEAHKGDSKDSVRKGYIRELAEGNGESNKGFIFNFSATFSDNFDLQTCAFNYNLERFNLQGYGKNIAVLDSDLKSFRDKEKNEEQIVKILESFILFCAMKKHRENIMQEFSKNLKLAYHQPLIIAVADKVNTQDAGIKLYFEAILQILKEDRDITPLAQNLYENLSQNQNLYFDKNLSLDEEFLELILTMDSKTLRKEMFYASQSSMIEACRIKGNTKEIVFKSKNAKEPFLLLNIGSIREWEKQYLSNLGIESGEDITNGYFQDINHSDSPIQIMMGSKVFSEGWDSNRVNMISFINIGSKNAKKYVLQTIGRGVRIEPFKGVRKRFGQCERLDFNLRERFRNKALGIETLFIMATQTEAIKGILEGLEEFIQSHPLSGFRKSKAFKPLLVPKYRDSTSLQNKPYTISKCDFKELKSYIESFDEDVLLLNESIRAKDLGYQTLCKVKEKIANEGETKAIKIDGDIQTLKAENALSVLERFFHTKSKELDKFEEIKDEICHFEKFSSTLDFSIVEEMNAKIKEIVEAKTMEEREDLESKGVPKEYIETILQAQQNEKRAEVYGYVLDSSLQEHYYNPLVIDERQDGRIVYAIKEKSEVEFLRELQKYVKDKDNALKNYEWCFSKIVENVDSIYIPYFDSQNQAYRKFYPDFIFWLRHKQSKEYKIIFIDPKGLTHEVNARDKAQGFESIFGKNGSSIGGNKTFLYYFNKQNILDSSLKIYTQSTIAEIFYL
ncbi:DEAD/DEAH box helicase family protein [uncultured Helicobacter sp.]|uniref:DEAD/DEAH box helicase family protein n=1 Tax=uncultured Helicobacter sp. TaxID=175537 RepID=UPI002607A5B3|nr:DEAD/DEAH box helicase family protein [uncultured Helicobacter sp.]